MRRYDVPVCVQFVVCRIVFCGAVVAAGVVYHEEQYASLHKTPHGAVRSPQERRGHVAFRDGTVLSSIRIRVSGPSSVPCPLVIGVVVERSAV